MDRHAPLFLVALALAACGPSRIEITPSTVQLYARGREARLHATPLSDNGRPLPTKVCRWSSSNEAVATVSGPHNEATVTAVGHGHAVVRCAIGSVSAEVPVSVTLVNRIEVSPATLELRMQDEATPTAVGARAIDADGREVGGRVVSTRCLDENVCRGDARGQIWPVGPGSTKVEVQIEDATAEISAHVVDARTAEGRPHAVKGNPMEHIGDPDPGTRGKKRSRR
jgi:hypothetical protein